MHLDGNRDGGGLLGRKTKKRNASNSGSDCSKNPSVDRSLGLSHKTILYKARTLPVADERVLVCAGRVYLATEARLAALGLVDELLVEVKGDHRRKGVLHDDGALEGLALSVASLVSDVEKDYVLASFGTGDLVVLGTARDLCVDTSSVGGA